MAGSAYEYWERVDELLDGKSLTTMCKDIGVKYHTLLVMRSDVRFPKRDLEEKIAKYLGVEPAYLMFGDMPKVPKDSDRISAIIEKVRKASDLELAMVEKILGIGG